MHTFIIRMEPREFSNIKSKNKIIILEEKLNMDFIIKLIIIIIGGGLGVLTSVAIVAGIIGTIIYKIYRKCRYHISLYD